MNNDVIAQIHYYFNFIQHTKIVSIKSIIITTFLTCTLITHFRGKVRLSFYRQIIDHSAFMSPINCLMYLFSKVPDTPYLDVSSVDNLDLLRNNWQKIKQEAMSLLSLDHIKASQTRNDAGFNTFFKRGWRRFYLKWYNNNHESAKKLCPYTVSLINQIPNVKAAMFALLPAHSKLGAHRDPYAGSIRYHLGLSTPNSEDCFILVDGEKYVWRDGEDVLFDETYVHEAYNNTDHDRLILFCDIVRPMHTKLGQFINNFFNNTLMRATISPNDNNDKTGIINKIYSYVSILQEKGQNYKSQNRRMYYTYKYSIFTLIIFAIIMI